MNAEKDRDATEKDRGAEGNERANGPVAAATAQQADVEGFVGGTLLPLLMRRSVLVGLWLAASAISSIQGPGFVLLMLIAGALVAVIALFWSSVRTLLGETPLTGADAYALAAPRAEEEQKQAVLRALKDLEFERSVGKISEEDYAALVAKYRAEAKRLLRALEEDARPRRESVEHLVRKRLVEAGLEAPLEPGAETSRSPAPTADEKKKTKKKRKAEPAGPSAGDAPTLETEAPERRVEIEPVDEPEAEKRSEPKKAEGKPRPNVDITWKSPLPTKTKESPAYVPPTKKCAECGTKNDPDANFCKKCGSKAFEPVQATAEDTSSDEPATSTTEPSKSSVTSGRDQDDAAAAEAESDAKTEEAAR